MLEISNAPLSLAAKGWICIHCIALGMLCMMILHYKFN
jgi:hypothetical protein